MQVLLTSVSGVSSAAQFLTILLVFLFVLFITYLTTKFVGKYQKTQNTSRNFEIIEAHRINNSSHLELIRIGKKYFVIAVSKDNTSVVCELAEDEIEIPEGQTNVLEGFSAIYTKAKDKFGNRGDKQ